VNDLPAALADPQTAARDLVAQTEHPRFGTVRQVGAIAKVGPEPPAYRRAPLLGEDGDDILRGLLGYDQATLDELAAAGAFGDPGAGRPAEPTEEQP
jgi:crotonobetainyl-CoA:carnitine CoA-transferase CaiB-like acyl-CoA transferase